MTRPWRLIVSLLAVLGAMLGAPSAGAQRVLRWGGDAEGGTPFVEADPANPSRVRGFDVEIAEMLARGLGRTPQFVQVAWASIPQSAERGDFDIGLSGVEERPELAAQHALTLPYYEFREVLAVRVADSARYRRLADLAGHRVATLGSTGAYQILLDAQAKTGLVPISYDDDVHPYGDLVAGRVDAVLLDHIIAERSLRRVGRGKFVIVPEPVATGHYVGVLARANVALRDSMNAILRARAWPTARSSARSARGACGTTRRPRTSGACSLRRRRRGHRRSPRRTPTPCREPRRRTPRSRTCRRCCARRA
ncbi:ABC-type transporter, periplasmic subunit family 3 (plasmid) [Gemmatirosa kalamazoonensis]|uniref:ABC-type transporter, periplasmic subunit family 3 n=1 Tax=Gemmatirosa kalamazoonensis TaxID=861299 RepID=W0RPA0_9BACT|nr:ABC transporter substrate-binding protein [Gemmatirosa kalamazoonensis]AHG92312.1 ABC-type transporter, periplasmic subunit family 3 [Gemmatirosa kalamazoonensis]